MSGLVARVEKGRLVLDEPTDLPEGMFINLVGDNEGDDLTDDERRVLHDALTVSWRSVEAGRLRLFADELASSLAIIGFTPNIGRLYRLSPVRGARRVLLKRRGYHVYYIPRPSHVDVIAV